MKYCPDCGETKTRDNFHVDRSHSTGLQTYCKPCGYQRTKAQRLANPERHRQARDAWYAANPEYSAAYRAGCSMADVRALRARGKCDICNSAKNLQIDHCHRTGRLRGLLCAQCNRGLGHFLDDPGRLRDAARYLAG